MNRNSFSLILSIRFLLAALLVPIGLMGQQATVTVDWNHILLVGKTTPTLQVVVNPLLRRGSPVHQGIFQALDSLGAEDVRYVPWFPYPRMVVAELQPPAKTRTYWDFSQIDPLVEDFMQATEGHAVMINFSTIPEWMFKTDKPVSYPSDPDQVDWDYSQGTMLRDTTLRELTNYYVRLFSWYTQGGFRDELGVYHSSGHHYKIPLWEVLNEVDFEHFPSPAAYTRVYDAITHALHRVSPSTRFVGMALAYENNPAWFTYFLDPAHHRYGIRPDGISYHFYGEPDGPGLSPAVYQYNLFDKADDFLDKVAYIENIRKRLSPKTFTDIDELGTILGDAYTSSIPDIYWNLSGALYGYLFIRLQQMGIDIVGESQLVGYPTQYPDVSMIDWRNGHPNARYRVLKLLKDNLGPGDTLVGTNSGTGAVEAQAYRTAFGNKLLLVNRRDQTIWMHVPRDFAEGQVEIVDSSTGEDPPRIIPLEDSLSLGPFAVAIIRSR